MSRKQTCTAWRECGGCSLINKPYSVQLASKQERINGLLNGLCDEIRPIVGAGNPYFYRNKVHAAFKSLKGGRVICGTYSAGSHRIIEAESCMIENQTAFKIIRDIKKLAISFRLPIYNEVSHTGTLRRVLVRCAEVTGEVMVVLVLGSNYFKSKNNFIKELLRLHPEITTIIVNVNTRHDSMILGDSSRVEYGPGFIYEKLLGYTYRISPESFFQVNLKQAEKLYSQAVELAGIKGKDTVIDAYCGTGTITLTVSKIAGRVIGVESNARAVKDAKQNMQKNNVKNVVFEQADATEYMKEYARQGGKCDVVILDPPRSGTTDEFIEACGILAPSRIVYVSCGPDTLARDLKKFREIGYYAKVAVPVDMFPNTDHIETVVQLFKAER